MVSLRRALQLSLLSVTSVAAALGATEVGLRAAGFSWHLRPEKVQFGWPHSLAEMENRYRPDPELIWARRDAPEILARARRERPDFVFVGDSCVELSSWPQRFTQLLAERHPQRPWRTESLGTAGWTTYQGRVLLLRDVLPLRPRVVTVGFGWNDHWLAFQRPDAQLAPLLSLDGSRWGGLRLVQLVEKGWIGGLGQRAGAHADTGPRVPLAEFRDNLRTIVQAARQHGVVPLLLTAPSGHVRGREPEYLRGRFLADLHALVPLHESYVAAVREVARAEHAPLCDLAASFAAMPQPRRVGSFRKDGIHTNERGDARIAQLVYDCAQREALLSATPAGDAAVPAPTASRPAARSAPPAGSRAGASPR